MFQMMVTERERALLCHVVQVVCCLGEPYMCNKKWQSWKLIVQVIIIMTIYVGSIYIDLGSF